MSNPLNGTRQVFVKTVSVLTSVATLLTLSGAAYLAPLTASAAVPSDYGLKEGNMISAAGSNDPDVYIVNDWGYKRLFLNPAIFNFYGQLTGGWSLVKNVTPAVRDAFPSSGLFRNCETNDQQVWAVEVTGEDTGVLHKVTMSGAAAVAQDPNFFKKVFCINNNEANWYSKSPNDYTSLSQVPVYVRVPGSTPTPTPVGVGPVSASLSSDNPASGTVIAGQGVADIARFTLSNPSGSAVAVNSLSFRKLGIAGDSTFANAYVFTQITPGAGIYGQRLTDANTLSSGIVNFNGGTSTNTIITIPAYSSVNVAFRTDVLAGSGGLSIGIALTAVNGMAVSGLNGNLFTVAAAPNDLSTAVFAATASLIPATGTTTTDPLKDTVVWQDQVTISNKNENLTRFALRQVNSINNADVSNFRLFIDGAQVAQVQNLDSNGYVTFVPSSPVTLLTGSRTIKILADITGGTGRVLTMSLRSSADVGLIDTNYGTNVAPTIVGAVAFPLTAGNLSVNNGSIVVQKDTTAPSGNVVRTSSDAVLGRWLFTAYGEPTKVSTLIAGLRLTNGSPAFVLDTSALRNGRIMAYPVGNPGAAQQFGSTTNLKYSNLASTSYTTNLTVVPGTPMMVELRADIYDSGDASDFTQAASTIVGTLYTGASNGQGMVSLSTTNVPAAQNAGNTLTVQTGAVTISQYANFTNQTITTPAAGKLIGDFVVSNSSTEAVNINTLTLGINVTGLAAVTDLSNVYLKWNGVNTSVKSSVTATGNSYSVSNTVLPINSSVHVQVYADMGTRASGTYVSTVSVSGISAQSSLTVNTQTAGTSSTAAATAFLGQTLTIGSGSVTSSLDGSSSVQKNVTANQSIDVSKFNFVAVNDSFTISEIQLKVLASTSQGGIQSVTLKNSATGAVIGTLPLNAATTNLDAQTIFGGLSLNVPANDPNGLTLTASVQTGNVGVNAATTGLDVGIAMQYFKKAPLSTGVITTDVNVRTGNHQYLYNAIPVVSSIALPTTLLGNSPMTIAKFSLATQGTGNAVTGWNKILLTVSKTSAPLIASSGMQLFEDGIDITSNTTIATTRIGTGQTSGQIYLTANNSPREFQIPAAGHTYELKATVTNSGTGDSINTTFGNASTHQTTTTAAGMVFNTASASLVWSDRTDTNEVGGHSTTTIDWQNDFLIKNLPFVQSLSR